MLSHIALLIVINSVKNNRLCSYGYGKYKVSSQVSCSIRWKCFFSTNEPPLIISSGVIVFITGKYVVENSEECVAITYASIIDTGKPECEFDITGIPICTPHCMITVYVNRTSKKN